MPAMTGAQASRGWRWLPAVFLSLCASALMAQQTTTASLSVPAGAELVEGAGNTTVRVTATLPASRAEDTTISLSLGGTAKSSDYEVVQTAAITIRSGWTSGVVNLTLKAVDDGFFEGPETIRIEGAAQGVEVSGVDLAITDNDKAPTLAVDATPQNLQIEEGGAADFVITVKLVGGGLFEEAETFTLSLASNSGIELPGDGAFSPAAPPWQLILPAGKSSAQIQAGFSARQDARTESRKYADMIASASIAGQTYTDSFRLFTLSDAADAQNTPTVFTVRCTPQPNLVGTTMSTCVAHRSGANPGRSVVLTMTAQDPDLVAPDSVELPIVNSGENNSAGKSVEFVVVQQAAGKQLRWNLSSNPPVGGTGNLPANTILNNYAVFVWPETDASFEISQYRLSMSSDDVLTRNEFAFLIVFTTPRPVTIVGSPAVEVVLDSGVVSVPCTASAVSGLITCEYRVQEGDYDYDGRIELRRGAVKFTGWRDRFDTDISGNVAAPLPAMKETHSGVPLIYGGTHAIDLRVSPQSAQEGVGAQTLEIIAQDLVGMSGASDLVIPLTFSDGTATSPDDYRVTGPLTVTIPAGQSEGRTSAVSITAIPDLVNEDRTETLRIEGSKGAMMSPFVRGIDFSIIDSAGVALSVAPTEIAEDGGAQTVEVTAAWGDAEDSVLPLDTEVTLAWSGADGAADYTRTGGDKVTIPANARTGTVEATLTPTDDTLLEDPEAILIEGTAPGRAVTAAELTLTDDEQAPVVTLSVDKNTLTEGGDPVAVTVTATIAATVPRTRPTTVTLDFGGAAIAGTDYTAQWG
ncbi:MAG: hypothetical protein F4147_01610, partial [Gammaproteobacteria bacterium]|nr:hypothetical protein [Gammaproteobacteria bacterium]